MEDRIEQKARSLRLLNQFLLEVKFWLKDFVQKRI
jgi:hypothetical protein